MSHDLPAYLLEVKLKLLGVRSSLLSRLRLTRNGDNLELSEVLTVTLQTVIALTLLKLEDELLLAAELLENLAGDLLVCKRLCIHVDGLTIIDHENVKHDLLTRLRVELLNVNDVALGNLILLAASRNDCVHVMPFIDGVGATAGYTTS